MAHLSKRRMSVSYEDTEIIQTVNIQGMLFLAQFSRHVSHISPSGLAHPWDNGLTRAALRLLTVVALVHVDIIKAGDAAMSAEFVLSLNRVNRGPTGINSSSNSNPKGAMSLFHSSKLKEVKSTPVQEGLFDAMVGRLQLHHTCVGRIFLRRNSTRWYYFYGCRANLTSMNHVRSGSNPNVNGSSSFPLTALCF
jgi:hypothetical protein